MVVSTARLACAAGCGECGAQSVCVSRVKCARAKTSAPIPRGSSEIAAEGRDLALEIMQAQHALLEHIGPTTYDSSLYHAARVLEPQAVVIREPSL